MDEFIKDIVKFIIKSHDLIIQETGGLKGVRDEGGLDTFAYKLVNKYVQKEFEVENLSKKECIELAAKTYQDLATRHYFFDGNKRTAHIVAKTLLFILSGFRYHLKVQYDEAEKFIIEIAKYESIISLKEIEKWIRENIEEVKDIDEDASIKDLEKELELMRKSQSNI